MKTTVALLLGAWLMFRFASDWPRGMFASGVASVPPWAMSLSYFGLCLWILVAIPVTLRLGKLPMRCRTDPITQAQLLFIGYQLVALGFSIANFGAEGAIAGTYILLVCLSFLVIYLLGMRLGESWSFEDVTKWIARGTRLVAWALAPTLLIAVVQLLTGTGKDVGDGISRIYGGTSSPNVLGSLLLIGSAPVFAIIAGRKRTMWPLFLLLMMVLFVACFSLAGFICAVATMGIYWLLTAAKSGRIPLKLSWLLGGVIAATILALVAGELLAARFASLGESENSLVWRLRTWTDVLDVLRSPQIFVFGGGLGFDHLGIEYPPHNEYLRVLVETGVLGLTLFALIWVRVYRGLRVAAASWHPSLQRYALALQAATAGLLIWAFADSVLRTAPSVILLWLLVGIAMGTARSRISLPHENCPN